MMKKYLGFVAVSLSSTAIELLLFRFFNHLLIDFFPLLYLSISTVIARIFSDSYKFFLDRNAVFGSKENMGLGMVRYIILAIAKTLASATLVTVLVFASKGNETIIKMIVDFCLFFPGFYIEKNWVHKV